MRAIRWVLNAIALVFVTPPASNETTATLSAWRWLG